MFAVCVSRSGQLAFLLENVPCNAASCHAAGRMFHIHWDQSDLGAVRNAVAATFFDIYEDVSGVCVLGSELSAVVSDGQTGNEESDCSSSGHVLGQTRHRQRN